MQTQSSPSNIDESVNNNEVADYQLWRIGRVLEFTGLSKSTLYDRIAKGKFSPPISLDGRSVAWRARDVIQWAKKCVEQTKKEGRDAYLYLGNINHMRKIKENTKKGTESLGTPNKDQGDDTYSMERAL